MMVLTRLLEDKKAEFGFAVLATVVIYDDMLRKSWARRAQKKM